MAVYVSTGYQGTAYPLTHGRLCWDATVGPITASTAADGFAAANAATVRTDSAWRPTATPASWSNAFAAATEISFIGIAKHDLGTQNATLSIEGDPEGATGWVVIPGLGSVQPGDDTPLLFLFPEGSYEAIRVRVTAADGNPTISVIRAGRAQEWPRPFVWTGQPITESDQISFENTLAVTGNWLGRSIASDGLSFSLTMNNATETWRQTDFAAFKAYANGEDAAFFVAPRPGSYPDEIAYAWATDVVTADRAMPNRRISTSVTLNCRGLRPADG